MTSTYDRRHGGPYDRGGADSYYRRAPAPHYFVGNTYASERIVPAPDSPEWIAYWAGYDDNERLGDHKDYE